MSTPDLPVGLPLWAAGGKPLSLKSETSVAIRGWEEVAFDDAGRFEADARATGLREDYVAQGMEVLGSAQNEAAEAVRSFWQNQPLQYIEAPEWLLTEAGEVYRTSRDTGLGRLRRWFAGQRVVVDRRDPTQVNLPLFLLAAPDVPGCVSTYEATDDRTRKLGWNVTIFGTGMSGAATVTSSVSSTLSADAGQALLIFLPVTVAVEQIRVVAKDGKTLGSGRRVDVSGAGQEHSAPGGLTLDAAALPAPGSRIETFPLAGYAAAKTAEYSRAYSQERSTKFTVGVKAAGVEASVAGEVSMGAKVTLTYQLTGGRDYHLCTPADGSGRVWAY